MNPTSGIQIRGDLTDLLFYRQHPEPPDEFRNFLAPHRDVLDFDHAILHGGVRMLERMIKAALKVEEFGWMDCRRIERGAEQDRESQELSLTQDALSNSEDIWELGWEWRFFDGDDFQEHELEGVEFTSEDNRASLLIQLTEEGQFAVSNVQVSLQITDDRFVLEINCSEETESYIQEGLDGSQQFDSIALYFVEEVELKARPITKSKSHSQVSVDFWPYNSLGKEEIVAIYRQISSCLLVDDPEVSASQLGLRRIEFPDDCPGYLTLFPNEQNKSVSLKINQKRRRKPIQTEYFEIHARALALDAKIAEIVRSKFPRLAESNHDENQQEDYSPNLVSGYGDLQPHENGKRQFLTAIWEIGAFGINYVTHKKGKQVFRLKGARGYLTDDAPHHVEGLYRSLGESSRVLDFLKEARGGVLSLCEGYSSQECDREYHYEYLCFIDLALGYSAPENYEEWSADLNRLQRKSRYEKRLIICNIGRCFPDLRRSDHEYRKLFEGHILQELDSITEELLDLLQDPALGFVDSPEEGKKYDEFLALCDRFRTCKQGDFKWSGEYCSLEIEEKREAVSGDSSSKEEWKPRLHFKLGSTVAEFRVSDRNGRTIEAFDDLPNMDFNLFHSDSPGTKASDASTETTGSKEKASVEASAEEKDNEVREFGLWDYLYVFFRQNTIVVVSANVIRAQGHLISHRLSWEKTAQDCIAALQYFPLSKLAKFGNLIIRVGLIGAVRVYPNRSYNEPGRTLFFDPIGQEDDEHPDAFYRDVSELGHMVGANTVICGAILAKTLKFISSKKSSAISLADQFNEGIEQGIQAGIKYVQTLYDCGYGPVSEKEIGWNNSYKPVGTGILHYEPSMILKGVFGKYAQQSPFVEKAGLKRKVDEKRAKPIGITPIITNARWKIIDEAARAGLYRIACKIAVHGMEKALNVTENRPPMDELHILGGEKFPGIAAWPEIVAPIIRFKKYVTTDRDEAECLRNIDGIMRAYRKDGGSNKPISIAVFGPPGAGKSFAVNELMQGIFKNPNVVTCNLSQLSDPKDLGSILLRFKETFKTDTTSVLFVDEFDCSLQDRPLGWLRYFLAVMQDGEFKHGQDDLHIDKCVLVFAGGVFQSFSDFAGQSTASSDEKRLEFAQAKGPDFVSRLSGHIDLIGINPQEKDVHGDDDGYVLRRAILLRSLLKKRGLVGKSRTSMLTPALIEAMLRVSHYNHGARSMEIVLKTCIGEGGRLSLPTLPQLRMHVNADQLVDLYNSAQRDPTIFVTRKGELIVDSGYFD